MSAARPHPLFPEQSAEETARHAFYRDLKDVVVGEVKPRIRENFEARLAPAHRQAIAAALTELRACRDMLRGELTGAASAAVGGKGDYRVVMKRAKEEKPDIFAWVGYEADAVPIVQQAREAGFAPPILVGAPPGWPVDFHQSPLSNNVLMYTAWTPALGKISKVSRHYSAAYKAEFNEEATAYLGALGYTSIHIAAEAIRKAGTLDTPALIAALKQTKYESPLGETVEFVPSKIIKHQGLHRQKIMQWQDGVLQVIWPFEFATAEIRYPYYKH